MNYTFTLRKLLCFLIVFTFVSTQVQGQTRPTYRTFDGTLNNLSYPQFGKTGIPFFRELPAEYADGKNAMVTNRPNPRLLSNKLSNEPEDDHNDRYMAGMFYSFGQFFDHDITRGQGGNESVPITLPSGEKIFTSPIPFTRSATHPGSGLTTARDQTNTTTAWVDASQIYSDNKKDADWLRTFSGGKLKVSSGNLLPFNTVTGEYDAAIDPNAPTMDDTRSRTGQLQKVFVAGDARASEHPVLTSLHTLFVREHNRLCEEMKYWGLSDEEIYQKARKEVGALMQSVVFGQWISSLGVSLTSYTGYKSTARPDIMNTFSTAAYRWHTMVENDIIFRDNSCRGVGPVELPLKEIFFNNTIVRKHGIDVLLKGISVHRSYETDLRVNSGLRNFLFGPGSGLDLVSINIQRGRDHGLPNYNTVRQFYTGSKAYTFTDIAGSSRTSVSSSIPSSSSPSSGSLISSEMQSLYGDVNRVDLWVGLYAEPRLSGKSVGKTVDAILRAQLQRLRDGDYYFFENDPAFTSTDKTRIRNTKLGDIIKRNTNASDFQDNVFFVKSCSSDPSKFDDIAKRSCNETPQYEGWTLVGKQGSKSYFRWNAGAANFEEAKLLTKRLGGHLPQVKNTTENNYLKGIIGSSSWLDLNRVGTQWHYTNEFDAADNLVIRGISPYFSWNTGEPNNGGGTENRSEMRTDGKWNDISETSLRTVIAEVECQEDCSVETTPPTFTSCPANITATYGLLSLGKSVSWATPTATDNCSGVSVVRTSGPSSGSFLWGGVYTVSYTATDARGNKSYCSFNITVSKTLSLFSLDQTIVSLEAKAEPNRTSLQWVSNLSTNENDYFIVKKLNTNSQQFDDLAIVNNTSSTNDFAQFVHYDSAPTEGDNFYKITAVLYDGSTKESEVKKVNFGKFSFVNVYPNPTESELNIDLKGYQDSPVSVYLYNSLGQPLLIKHVDAAASSLIQLDVTNIPVGQYLVRVTSKGKKDMTKSVSVSH